MGDKKQPDKREKGRKGKKFGESSRSRRTSATDASTDDAKRKREAKKREQAEEDSCDSTDLTEMLVQDLLWREYSLGSSSQQDKKSQDLVNTDDLKAAEGAHSVEQNIKQEVSDTFCEVTKLAREMLLDSKRLEEERLKAYEEKTRKNSQETKDTQVPEEKASITLRELQSALYNVLSDLEDKELDEERGSGDTKKTDSDEE